MRRTKVSLIYRRTKNLRALQLLLGHTKLEITVRYLGIEVDDALETGLVYRLDVKPTGWSETKGIQNPHTGVLHVLHVSSYQR
jgi:hypothetical protein